VKEMLLDLKKLTGVGEYMLINTDDYFVAKDGQSYRAVWGLAKVIEAKEVLGLKPTNSANWYLQVGTDENCMFIAGCKIHYAQLCLNKPIGANTLVLN
jgi:hypothetical protein